MSSTSFDYVVELLEHVTIKGTQAMGRCPAHEDHNPSLSVAYKNKRTLVKCMAGCDTQDVLASLGLSWDALFDEPPERDVKVHTYEYLRPDGKLHMTVARWQKHDGKKTFTQSDASGAPVVRDMKPCLYNLPLVIPHCRNGGEVWVVEGEKDVHALRRHNIVATTAPMGAGKWRPYYWRWLEGASRVVVVADRDRDGNKHCAMVAADLRAHGMVVETVEPADGKDAFDHFASGHGVTDFRPFNPGRLRPRGIKAAELRRKLYPPIRWAVPNMLPAGLAILGGTVKIGKSWLALDIALGVSRGTTCLGGFRCCEGPVLYLSLDNDSERRLQARLNHIHATQDDPEIEFHTDWPTGVEAVSACQEWITEVRVPRLIVIDTLVRVEPEFDRGEYGSSTYSKCTDVLTRWARLASDNELTVLAVHHDRKSNGDNKEDWVDRFSGSRGLTASASTLLFLDAQRGKSEGILHITGRDVECQDQEIHLAAKLWHATGLLAQSEPPAPEPVPDDPGQQQFGGIP